MGVVLADLVALKRIAGGERDLVDLYDLEVAHCELPDTGSTHPAPEPKARFVLGR